MSFSSIDFPVKVDLNACIADKGCTVCIDACPLDVLVNRPRYWQSRYEI